MNGIFSSRGQSLIQLLVGVAILSILMLAMSTMLSGIHRESRAINEKLAALDMERAMISSLADGSVCKYVLNTPTPLTFNSGALPQTITLPEPAAGVKPALYSSILAGPTPGPIIAQVDASVSPLAPTMTVSSIQLQIMEGSSGSYKARWLVNFNDVTTSRALKPVSVGTTLSVDDVTNPAQATVSECMGVVMGDTTPLLMNYYRMYWDQTNNCRNSPGAFTKSFTGTFPSIGDIFINHQDAIYSSALFEMIVRAPAAVAVTQELRGSDDQIYFWLNGTKIDEDTAPGWKSKTITWNLTAGDNVVQVIANNCGGGVESVHLVGDFFARYPQLEFVPEIVP